MSQYVSDDNETLPSGVIFAGDEWSVKFTRM